MYSFILYTTSCAFPYYPSLFFFICHSFLITPALCFISIQSKEMALGVICVICWWQNRGRHQRSGRRRQLPNLRWCLPVTRSRAREFAAHKSEGRKLVSVIRCDTSQCKSRHLTWQPRTHTRCLRHGPRGHKQTLTGIWIYSGTHRGATLMNTAHLFCL